VIPVSAPDSHYVHGTEPAEQQRLSTLNRLLNQTSLAEMAPRPGERALDLGCGLAQFTRDIARATSVQALGIERSPEQIEEALRQAREAGEEALIEIRAGDALDPPLTAAEWGSFDLAHARFVLEHVPDPARVVHHLVRAARVGGRIVLEDDDHDVLRLHPEPAGFRELWECYIRTYDRLSNDPYVGRKLVSLLVEAGATPRRNTWLFFGTCAGDDRFRLLCDNLAGVLSGAREAMLATGILDAARFDRSMAELGAWGGRGDAAIWFARCWAEGVRRA
jgi:SAM-dependent methyltransferase